MDNTDIYNNDRKIILGMLEDLMTAISEEHYCIHSLFSAIAVSNFLRDVLITDEEHVIEGTQN